MTLLAPFLLLIVAEGLASLVGKVVQMDRFQAYKVNAEISYPILHFADDTILTCEASWDNLWCIKAIFRGFELVSGLKVNFFKSNLFGLNLDDSFLHAASTFLSCCIGNVAFKFLGIPFGANLKRCSTWEPVVDSLKKRLHSWSRRHLSTGGRVTLISINKHASLFIIFL